MTETAAINTNFFLRAPDLVSDITSIPTETINPAQSIDQSYQAARIWNDLPADSTNISSLHSFEYSLTSSILSRHSAVYFLDFVIVFVTLF